MTSPADRTLQLAEEIAELLTHEGTKSAVIGAVLTVRAPDSEPVQVVN